MIRPALYVFSKSEEMKNSISRYIRYIGIDCKKLKHHFEPEIHAHTYSVLGKITFTLDNESPEALLNTVVILDISDADHDIALSLNPIIDSDSTGQIISSLILAYPEVYWIILGTSFNRPNFQNGSNCEWKSEHFVEATNMDSVIELLNRHQNGYRTIFDPSGLRRWIKNKVLKDEVQNSTSKELEEIKKANDLNADNCAVVIEEELPFTYLNGYVAYCSGYHCYMITSESEMQKVLRDENKNIKISLEDLDIKLSGMSEANVEELRDLYRRAEGFETLRKIGSLDFCIEEFDSPLAVEILCKAINAYTCNVSLKATTNTIEWLNELLGIPNFFEILVLQKPNPRFSRDIMILVKKTRNYRLGNNHQDEISFSDFFADEFKDKLAVKKLCQAINKKKDDYDIHPTQQIDTIEWLNEILTIHNLYEKITSKKDGNKLSGYLTKLKTDYDTLQNKEKLKRLNRCLLEEIYTDKVPKLIVRINLIKRLNRLLLEENYPEEIPNDQKKRLIVTGIAKEGEEEKYKYIFEIIHKPYAGIYDLKNYFPENKSKNSALITYSQESHSAPNRILAIANSLIGRTRKILDNAKSCEEFVFGAILALEAKELLCGQSMTTALEAVSLQHQMEVHAECTFLGVAREIKVEPRFKEIASEVRKIIKIPDKPNSTVSAQSYNTQLEIVSNIRCIFNDYEQFDEEERCINEIRKYRRRLHWHESWHEGTNAIAKIAKRAYSVIELYFNFLMSNRGYIPWKLGFASLCWILLFAVVLTCCCPTQFLVNLPDFNASEFKHSSDLRKLCRETTKKGFGKHIHARIDSVGRLNELLQVPNLYDSVLHVLKKRTDNTPLDTINTLVNEIQVYRDQRYLNLEGDAQDTIKKLNRRLLEETYPGITPKHDTYKIDYFSAFMKSGHLYLFTFLDLSHQAEATGWVLFFSIFEILIAHVHLGIFISYLFQKLARR